MSQCALKVPKTWGTLGQKLQLVLIAISSQEIVILLNTLDTLKDETLSFIYV